MPVRLPVLRAQQGAKYYRKLYSARPRHRWVAGKAEIVAKATTVRCHAGQEARNPRAPHQISPTCNRVIGGLRRG